MERASAAPQVEKTPVDNALSELQKNPDALKNLAKNPEFQRSLDSLKSNPVVKEALDRAWNAALVTLFRNGFQDADPAKQAEMIKALPENDRTVLAFHVRAYDKDNGADLSVPDANKPETLAGSPESLSAVAASMRRSIEVGKNAEVLKKSDIKGRFDAIKSSAKEAAAAGGESADLSKALDKMDVATMTEKDVSKLRAMGADLSKIFLVGADGSPCQGKADILGKSMNAEPGKSTGLKFVVDFGKNDKVNKSVGA